MISLIVLEKSLQAISSPNAKIASWKMSNTIISAEKTISVLPYICSMNSGRKSVAKARQMTFIISGRVIQNFKFSPIAFVFRVFSEAMFL